jgi:tetratricopeptide (TPR) repeat protein
VIDDEKLQELLTKASSLYHSGEYQGAIEAWKAVLAIDPRSQKAQEGIRMSTLLLADWEPPGAGASSSEPTVVDPADGADPAASNLSAEEKEARLDLGIARVRQLLAERKYSEAIEGAQGLLPAHRESEEIRKLLDEAQQAFESAPFIDEHFTLARELANQERFAEAERQCRKVLALDGNHKEARELLARIRSRLGEDLQRAAEQLGGMTVKLNVADLGEIDTSSPEPTAEQAVPESPEPSAPAQEEGGRVADAPDADAPFDLTADVLIAQEESLSAPEDALPTPDEATPDGEDPLAAIDGDAAAMQEEVASRAALEAAFSGESQGEEGGPPAPAAAAEDGGPTTGAEVLTDPEPLGIPGADAGPGDAAATDVAQEPTVVEAKTVGPPTNRLVPSQPAPAVSGPAPGQPAPQEPPVTGEAGDQFEDAAAWETELTQLNLKVGERELLKGTGANMSDVPPEGVDADLMSLIDNNAIADPGESPAAPVSGGIPVATVDSDESGDILNSGEPLLPSAAAKPATPTPAVPEGKQPAVESPLSKAPVTGVRARPVSKRAVQPPDLFKEPSRVPKYFALIGLLLLVGGAAVWWFYFQPRSVGGAGAPGEPGPPPSDPGVEAVVSSQGPIPTPIGGGNRPAAQEGQGQAATVPEAAAVGAAPQEETPTEMEPPDRPLTPDQIKKEPPPMSPQEIRRKVASFKAKGQHLLRLKNWREARSVLQAALALDPVNFEVQELADQAEAKLDEERKLQESFDSANKLFKDQDYQGCLWKLYRLPRDKGLGDIDLFIRNTWYNWGVVSMRAGDTGGSLEKVAEVLQIDPQDQDALKIQEVAEKYRARAKDRIFYAFAKSLRLRPIDQR